MLIQHQLTKQRQRQANISLTEHLLHHVGLLPFVAQQIRGDAGQNDAGAYQALERSGPEGHNDHENAAQHKRDRDEEVHLQKEHISKPLHPK